MVAVHYFVAANCSCCCGGEVVVLTGVVFLQVAAPSLVWYCNAQDDRVIVNTSSWDERFSRKSGRRWALEARVVHSSCKVSSKGRIGLGKMELRRTPISFASWQRPGPELRMAVAGTQAVKQADGETGRTNQ